MEVQVILCETQSGDQLVIGVFDDEEIANRTYDALEQFGDASRKYTIDTYKLNEIQKGRF